MLFGSLERGKNVTACLYLCCIVPIGCIYGSQMLLNMLFMELCTFKGVYIYMSKALGRLAVILNTADVGWTPVTHAASYIPRVSSCLFSNSNETKICDETRLLSALTSRSFTQVCSLRFKASVRNSTLVTVECEIKSLFLSKLLF